MKKRAVLIGTFACIGFAGLSACSGDSGGGGSNATGSGGKSGTGGTSAASGGAAHGGASTGGVVGTGGSVSANGGAPNGGAASGGMAHGGAASGGASSGGAANGGSGPPNGGAASGGAAARGGNAGTAGEGGTSAGGTSAGGTSAGGGTSNGGSGGGSVASFCPAASTLTGSPIPASASVTRVSGAPPQDSFNMNNFTNVEGPVWIGDSLYFSEMLGGNNPPPKSRILKLTGDQVSVFLDDSGSNGLAVDNDGNLIAASHGVGGIVRFALPDKTPTTIVSKYNGTRFNSPNDLTFRSDGTLYFTDPDFQNSARPQSATRAYQVPPGSDTPKPIAADYTSNPNGITLSIDEKSLFISGAMGVKKYTFDSAGAVPDTGTNFGSGLTSATDGMAMDCAGNLYVAVASSTNIVVVDPNGMPVANSPIKVNGPQAVTNVAFGGPDHKTLYITGQGSSGSQGVFKVNLNFPGLPY